ncbi:MAG: class I tRNA ligase family protein [Candidatus Moraniibacteriota bacterium]
MPKPFFVTTPIYYVNGHPHLGHAYTTIAADVIARFQKGLGQEVFFSVGTDEHGAKVATKAKESGKEPKEFVDEISAEFKTLWKKLNIDYTRFIRTTDPAHIAAVQKVLQTLFEKGAIYKGFYEGLYCVGCEQFKNEDDLVDGKCPDHGTIPELMKEESYLMKMTELQEKLIEKIKIDELAVRPERYKKEILSFLEGEKLEDISISRKNVSWGIPLPFDSMHTTYVWVDALLNYLTILGWDGNEKNIPQEWPADVQFIGKDILRVHATIWPVILMHLGIPIQKLLFTHGHILSGGKKMSKTLGNVISIDELLERFGVDGTRYLLLSAGPFGEDVDVTMERLTEKYNADLANGLGNLVSRVVKLSEQLDELPEGGFFQPKEEEALMPALHLVKEYKLAQALNDIWVQIRKLNQEIDEKKPWEMVKTDGEAFRKVMTNLLERISLIGVSLQPFMPETSQKINEALEKGKVEPLFQRIK